jgi:hypothetical protein
MGWVPTPGFSSIFNGADSYTRSLLPIQKSKCLSAVILADSKERIPFPTRNGDAMTSGAKPGFSLVIQPWLSLCGDFGRV